jgi:hypothetical protein
MLQLKFVKFKYVFFIINIAGVIKMEKKILCIFVCMLLIATTVLPVAGNVSITPMDTYKITNEKFKEKYSDFVPGEFFVKFKEGTKLSLLMLDNIMTTSIS